MKITKKILSVLMAVILLMSASMTGAYAAPGGGGSSGGIVKTIDRVDITLRTDVAGKTAWDYKDIYTIETPYVTYHDNGFYSDVPAMSIYYKDDLLTIGFDRKMVVGGAYRFVFYLVADPMCKFSDNCKVYINGKTPKNYSCSLDWDNLISSLPRQYMDIRVEDLYTVTAQPGACKYCGEFHTGFFGKLTGFFHGILALFGMHK